MSSGHAGPGSLLAMLGQDQLLQCMRCGFCLSACPTYRLYGREANSPRGRIALSRAAVEGQLDWLEILTPLDQCIGCRACEPACPAGVRYGAILEQARAVTGARRPRPWPARVVRRVGLGWLLGTPAGIRLSGWGLWFWQASGLAAVVRRLGLVRAVAGPAVAALEAALPRVPGPAARRAGGGPGRAFPAGGRRRARVAFFTGCLMEIAFWRENRDAVRLLQDAGCEVVITPGQGCCGAVHAHAGEEAVAHAQARRNIAAFEAEPADFIVNAAGGCGAALKEYRDSFRADSAWADRARRFSERVRDISEILAELGPPTPGPTAPGPPTPGPLAGRVTYQDSCHLRHVQKVVGQPRQLLRQVPGVEFVELPGADSCCGAGGIYSVTQPATAARLGDEKMEGLRRTGARTLVVANPPCQLHLQARLQAAGLDREGYKVVHIATLLRRAAAANAGAAAAPPAPAAGQGSGT